MNAGGIAGANNAEGNYSINASMLKAALETTLVLMLEATLISKSVTMPKTTLEATLDAFGLIQW